MASINIPMLALGLSMMTLFLTLAQRLADYRSKTIARILVVMASLIGVVWIYFVLLSFFGINLGALVQGQPGWFVTSAIASLAAILAWFLGRRSTIAPPTQPTPSKVDEHSRAIVKAFLDDMGPELGAPMIVALRHLVVNRELRFGEPDTPTAANMNAHDLEILLRTAANAGLVRWRTDRSDRSVVGQAFVFEIVPGMLAAVEEAIY